MIATGVALEGSFGALDVSRSPSNAAQAHRPPQRSSLVFDRRSPHFRLRLTPIPGSALAQRSRQTGYRGGR